MHSATWPRRTITWILLGAVVFYLAATAIITATKEPHIDEAWLASPGRNLAFHGDMGSRPLEPRGSWLIGELTGIRDYTYWVPPLGFVMRAAWYKALGFGVVQTRALSILWGLAELAAWFLIVRRLAGPVAASIAVALIATDVTFLWLAADGRLDMTYSALGSLALAAYLELRESNLRRALFVSACFAAASICTHPNGVLWNVLLFGMVLLYDRRRLRLPLVLPALVPYAVFGAGWLAYIARHPDYFVAQWMANVFTTPLKRGVGPLRALLREAGRWVYHYGFGYGWMWPMPKFSILVPALYWTAVAAAFVVAWRKRDHALALLAAVIVVTEAAMTFGDGVKLPYYLGMVLPEMAAMIGILFVRLDSRGGRAALACAIAPLIAVQTLTLGYKVRFNGLTEEYRAVVEFLKQNPKATVTGSSALAFEIDDGRLSDDLRLGRFTGRNPDYIVRDRAYNGFWMLFEQFDPASAAYIHRKLKEDYQLDFQGRWYQIYERKRTALAASGVHR